MPDLDTGAGAALLDVAAAVLTASGHREHVRNEYGKTVVPGWRIDDGADEVRVEHVLPPDIVGDPDRMTSDERYLARLRSRDAYAQAFTAAGWRVRTKTVGGNNSILLAQRPERHDQQSPGA
jgi:hypothetical protein